LQAWTAPVHLPKELFQANRQTELREELRSSNEPSLPKVFQKKRVDFS
jgi:hypothetical protein